VNIKDIYWKILFYLFNLFYLNHPYFILLNQPHSTKKHLQYNNKIIFLREIL